MKLPSKALKEFKAIIKKDYGKDISDADAQELGISLLRLTRVALSATVRSINEKTKKEKTNLQ